VEDDQVEEEEDEDVYISKNKLKKGKGKANAADDAKITDANKPKKLSKKKQ